MNTSLPELETFIGTQQYHKEALFPDKYTDGVAYVMENGYAWLVTDALSVINHFANGDLKEQEFLCIELRLLNHNEADLVITDGNEKELYKQHYGYTDAQVELKLFWADGVLLLAGEY